MIKFLKFLPYPIVGGLVGGLLMRLVFAGHWLLTLILFVVVALLYWAFAAYMLSDAHWNRVAHRG